MMSLAELSVVIVGYGSIGRRHADNLRQLGVRRIVLLRRSERANPAFQPLPDVEVIHDPATAISLSPNLAIVCNPTQLHVDAALPFLTAGVPVLIEKPVAAELRDARRLQAAAKKHDTFCGVAYCMRYHPAYALARQAMVQGHIGRPLYVRAWFESWLPSWHPWEDYRRSYAARRELGGGVLPTLDHEIDFLGWCLGRPRHVQGASHRSGVLAVHVDDVASLSIEFAGGVTTDCVLSFCRQDRQRGFEFVGSQASLRYSLQTGQLLVCSPDQPDQVLWDGGQYDSNQMYLDLLADFLNAVARGAQPPIALGAGIAALEVAAQVRSRSSNA